MVGWIWAWGTFVGAGWVGTEDCGLAVTGKGMVTVGAAGGWVVNGDLLLEAGRAQAEMAASKINARRYTIRFIILSFTEDIPRIGEMRFPFDLT